MPGDSTSLPTTSPIQTEAPKLKKSLQKCKRELSDNDTDKKKPNKRTKKRENRDSDLTQQREAAEKADYIKDKQKQHDCEAILKNVSKDVEAWTIRTYKTITAAAPYLLQHCSIATRRSGKNSRGFSLRCK
ncbi:uncharacterized protein EDB91DRAFT_1085218 [Suillus paluster]|uniref:uncharacterized protein n=1 Tax=Suillus paluster TaxID=48578 RepID=UPI001B85D0AB|nr:uncharacterized protein EDB91DRAFT_1085218 [Suillus paluster]KAG1731105.1 hypothetical protein EDB91DRAFT_1085218 [Suillus paluster]